MTRGEMTGKPKLRLRCPVAVEGKYDKIRLANLVETPILVLGGFSVFNDGEKKALLRRICTESGLILLTDSDRAGAFLRSKLKGILPEGKLYQVYAPMRAGKEARKKAPSADGLLGVEGIDDGTLYALLAPFADANAETGGAGITKAQWYADGFSGGEGSSEKRKRLARALDLPENLSSGALLEAINLLCSGEAYERAKESL
ncbi:MAG: DUF4093 domain-containing protein [Oscillospiraceae bacterium]|nr:DUF4093 domain-containing protein [Oscillospiraceae bacterium]